MNALRRHPYLLLLLLAASVALAFQAVRTVAKRQTPTVSLAALAPQGALLSIESPDFAAVLHSWNTSSEQKRWLGSANFSVFSNSRLFGRLSDAETEFAAASEIPAGTLLPQVAGKQSLFAWYDVGNLEFLYITRMPAGEAAQTDLLKSRGKWKQRESAGTPFYVRTSGDGSSTTKRTVAFAAVNGLFFLSTREDLLANALALLARQDSANSLAGEPWFTDANAALRPETAAAPILHMVLNLDRIVPLPQFRTYWVQGNVTEMKQYRASTADLYREASAFREERVLLLKTPDEGLPADPDLGPIAALAPAEGVFRASATSDPDEAVTAIEEKLLGRATLPSLPATEADDPLLSTPNAGSATDLETRIDTPAPVAVTFANAALASAFASADLDQMLTYQESRLPESATGLWVPIHAAVVLHGGGSWNPQTLAFALQQSLRGTLTAASFGIEFHPVSGSSGVVYALSGPKPLFFAVRGPMLLLADDRALLDSLLTPKPTPAANRASRIAAFNHTAQRAPFARLTGLIDGTNGSAVADAAPTSPAFFSGNLRSLSDAFGTLSFEQLRERHDGPNLRQTVLYQWKR